MSVPYNFLFDLYILGNFVSVYYICATLRKRYSERNRIMPEKVFERKDKEFLRTFNLTKTDHLILTSQIVTNSDPRVLKMLFLSK